MAVPALAVAVAAAVAEPAPSESDEPVLHEYVAPPPAPSGATSILDPGALPRVFEDSVSDGPQNPSALRHNGKLIPEPPKTPDAVGNEPTFGRRGFASDRETSAELDRATEADGRLYYVEVFNPSVLPFKRMSALDAVAEDYTLALADATRRDLVVGGETSSDRDLFWASMRVELQAGRDVAIPSVAPDSGIL